MVLSTMVDEAGGQNLFALIVVGCKAQRLAHGLKLVLLQFAKISNHVGLRSHGGKVAKEVDKRLPTIRPFRSPIMRATAMPIVDAQGPITAVKTAGRGRGGRALRPTHVLVHVHVRSIKADSGVQSLARIVQWKLVGWAGSSS